jgi:hypothetical protein
MIALRAATQIAAESATTPVPSPTGRGDGGEVPGRIGN